MDQLLALPCSGFSWIATALVVMVMGQTGCVGVQSVATPCSMLVGELTSSGETSGAEVVALVASCEAAKISLAGSILGQSLDLAEAWVDRGDIEEARTWYNAASRAAKTGLALEAEDAVRLLNGEGLIAWSDSDTERARDRHQEALSRITDAPGFRLADRVVARVGLGRALARLGKGEEGIGQLELALKEVESVDPVDQRLLGMVWHGLGLVRGDGGDVEGTRAAFERALVIREKVLGPEHPDTALTLNNLGANASNLGDYATAQGYYERALAIQEKVLGPEHPDTAWTLNSLGNNAREMGDYATAQGYYERALAIQEKVLGRESPATAQALNALGNNATDRGDYASAQRYHERALAIQKDARGSEHLDTVETLCFLGLNATEQDDYAVAQGYYNQALAILEKVPGPEHLGTGFVLIAVARNEHHNSQFDLAMLHYERALTIYERTLGPINPVVATILNNLGVTATAAGNHSTATQYLRRALAIQEVAFDVSPTSRSPYRAYLAQTLENLGVNAASTGDLVGAESYLDRAHELQSFQFDVGELLEPTPAIIGLGSNADKLSAFASEAGSFLPDVDMVSALALRDPSKGILSNLGGGVGRKQRLLISIAANEIKSAYLYGQFMRAQGVVEAERLTAESKIRIKALLHDDVSRDTLQDTDELAYENLIDYFANAEDALWQAFKISKTLFGSKHPWTVSSRLAFAQAYCGSVGHLEPNPDIRECSIPVEYDSRLRSVDTRVLAAVARAAKELGEYQVAQEILEHALAIYESPNVQMGVPDSEGLFQILVRVELAEIAQTRDEFTRAEKLFHSTFAIFSREPDLQESYLPDAQFLYGELLHKTRRTDEAIFYGKLAVNGFQATRAGLSGRLEASFLKSREDNYRSVVQWLVEAGRIPEAEQVWGMLKVEGYQEYMRDGAEEGARPPVTMTATEARLAALQPSAQVEQHAEFVALERKRKRKQGEWTPADEARLRELEAQRDQWQKDYAGFLEEVRRTLVPEKDLMEAARKAREDEIGVINKALSQAEGAGKSLRADEALVFFVVGEDTLSIVMKRPGVPPLSEQRALDRKLLREQVRAYRTAILSKADAKAEGEVLYRELIAPIEAHLRAVSGTAERAQLKEVKRLWVSLDDALRYVPMAGLWDGEHYLVERYETALYALSPGGRQELPAVESLRVAGFAMTEAAPKQGFSRKLDMAAKEVEAIVREGQGNGILPGARWINAAFTERELTRSLRDYPVVHVATHYKLAPGNAEESKLLLGDKSLMTLSALGRVTTDDATEEGDNQGVQLLTLSACETAAQSADVKTQGAEVEALGMTMFGRGAGSVLATLWKVSDRGTKRMMVEFYGELAQGKAAGAAVREAQLRMLRGEIQGYQTPFYWAPFVLMEGL